MNHMNIFDRLRSDHEKQRDLCGFLLQTSGDSEERARLYRELRKEIETHGAAEEETFYAELLRHERTRQWTRGNIAAHQEMTELLADLDETDMGSPAWLSKFWRLREELEHHMDEEERELFRAVDIGPRRARQLAEEFDDHKTARI